MQRSFKQASLSPRELEVLCMIAKGFKNQAIAIQLGIVQRTVEQHITNILSKLEVSDRTSAVIKGIHEGWIDP